MLLMVETSLKDNVNWKKRVNLIGNIFQFTLFFVRSFKEHRLRNIEQLFQ